MRQGGEGAPVVADGPVPQEALLPDLQQQASVQVPHLAGGTRLQPTFTFTSFLFI